MSLTEHIPATDHLDPIDIVEHLAEHHDWDFDRVAEDQIAMAVEGRWRTYSITLAWAAARRDAAPCRDLRDSSRRRIGCRRCTTC